MRRSSRDADSRGEKYFGPHPPPGSAFSGMDTKQELQIVRRTYARQVLTAVGVADACLEAAFADVRREDFLGPGPWQICRAPGVYVQTPSADPVYLYTDALVGILPERNLNNGQPSLHAALIHTAAIEEGDHVVHVGAGTGYYSAIMAHVAGPSGALTAIEFDPALAARAQSNLAALPRAQVVSGDGTQVPFAPADVIYVNAGVTRPPVIWLDRLKEGGRLILPLTTRKNFMALGSGATDFSQLHTQMLLSGAVFRIERHGEQFDARWICTIGIFPAEGARDEASERALAAALENGNAHKVTRLHRNNTSPAEDCWLRGEGWCLAYK
jgi:protein-L-isoaspartate(D-aspartate) O-methyltransferase